jgi:hypothetical protein
VQKWKSAEVEGATRLGYSACSLVGVDIRVMVALITEAVSISKTSVNFYEATWRNIPEGYLHTCRVKA